MRSPEHRSLLEKQELGLEENGERSGEMGLR